MFRKPEGFLALLSGHVSRLHVVENWRSRQLSHAFKFLFAATPPPWPFSSFQREHLQLHYKHGHPAPTFTIIEHDGKRGWNWTQYLPKATWSLTRTLLCPSLLLIPCPNNIFQGTRASSYFARTSCEQHVSRRSDCCFAQWRIFYLHRPQTEAVGGR